MDFKCFLILVLFSVANVQSTKKEQHHFSNANLYEISCVTAMDNLNAITVDNEDLYFSCVSRGTYHPSMVILGRKTSPVPVQDFCLLRNVSLNPLHTDIPPPFNA